MLTCTKRSSGLHDGDAGFCEIDSFRISSAFMDHVIYHVYSDLMPVFTSLSKNHIVKCNNWKRYLDE
jgi:hypothetical protein